MKKYLLISLFAVAASNVFAADANNVGCGWGSMIFDGKSDKASHILANTTNNSLGSQTFGISSGTAGCSHSSTVKKYAAVSTFMTANVDKVAHDMSIGQGESLDTITALMGMSTEHKAVFAQLVKENFAAIFPTSTTTSEQAANHF